MQALKSINSLRFKTYQGKEIAKIMDPLTDLSINVFREYPYLYEGSTAYLDRYLDTKGSFVLMVFENEQAVGAATAAPLTEEYEDFRIPFVKAGINPAEVFFFGDAMLLPVYRGMGIYKTFMHERTQAAIAYGTTMCTFLAVNRPDGHPLKPANYKDLKPIWNHYGFIEHPEIKPHYSWKDIDQQEETQKPFSAWMKIL